MNGIKNKRLMAMVGAATGIGSQSGASQAWAITLALTARSGPCSDLELNFYPIVPA